MRQRIYSKLRKGWDRDRYNAEGYKDMTAYLALRRLEREERGKREERVRSGEVLPEQAGNVARQVTRRPKGLASRRDAQGDNASRRDECSIRAYKREHVESWRRASERARRGRRCAKVRAGNRACREDERYCWEELANGIIIQAAQDWRAAMAILQENPEDPEARETVRETESFFLSAYYATLTKVDGAWLLRRLKEELIIDN